MEMPELFEHFRSMAQQLGARTVYGEPVVSGETTIVPVASVAFGFGGGFGEGTEAKRPGKGGGGGMGFRGMPAGYIEITPAGTRFVPVYEKQKMAAAVSLGITIGLIVGKLRRHKR